MQRWCADQRSDLELMSEAGGVFVHAYEKHVCVTNVLISVSTMENRVLV